ncbi:CcmD family protein [Chitinophaga lutea]
MAKSFNSFFILILAALLFSAPAFSQADTAAVPSALTGDSALTQTPSTPVAADNAQQNTETGAVNEFFRSDSKIYVAVGLLVIIFICIVLYLVRLDRRISKLEKE